MEKFQDFKATASYPCGKKSFLDFFKKKTYIKDLDGNVLYEGRGSFQSVLEQAVKEGIELPRADLSNRTFKGLEIPNAKLPEASFENSVLTDKGEGFVLDAKDFISGWPVEREPSNLANSDLKGVSFKNGRIEGSTILRECDVEKADFENCKTNGFHLTNDACASMKNFDKAYNIKKDDLEWWQASQPRVAESKQRNKTVNPKPTALSIAQLKATKDR